MVSSSQDTGAHGNVLLRQRSLWCLLWPPSRWHRAARWGRRLRRLALDVSSFQLPCPHEELLFPGSLTQTQLPPRGHRLRPPRPPDLRRPPRLPHDRQVAPARRSQVPRAHAHRLSRRQDQRQVPDREKTLQLAHLAPGTQGLATIPSSTCFLVKRGAQLRFEVQYTNNNYWYGV